MNSILAIALLWSSATEASTVEVEDPPPPPTRSSAAPDAAATEVLLSLEDYVLRVLETDLELYVAVLDRDIARAGVQEAVGAFDPELFGSARGSDDQIPTAFAFQAEKNQTLNVNLGLRGLLRSGASYGFSYVYDYQRQSPQNAFNALNPTHTSAVVLDFTQPLLRNAGTAVTEAGLETSRLVLQQADYDLIDRVQLKAYEAVQAYWNLVFALRRRATAREAFQVAEELVQNNQRKLEAGIMTRIDVVIAEAEAARRREELITAESQAVGAQDALKKLLNPGEDLEQWSIVYTPITEPSLIEVALPAESTSVETAFAYRNDLRTFYAELQKADLNLAVADNQILPQFDVSGSYGLSGLAGESDDPSVTAEIDDNNYDNFIKSTRPIRRGDFIRWSLGVDFAYPIGNRTAQGGLERARLEKERAWMNWRILRMNIVQQVRDVRRQVVDGRARAEAAIQARVLAEEQYEAEQIRLNNQHSTTFEVREAQRDLFEAIDQETRTLVDFEIVLANLSQVQGRLAQEFGVEWDEPEPIEGALLE